MKWDGRKYLPLLWLLLGCVCLLFMGGKWNIAILTWAGSVFFLRYFRTRRGTPGFLLALPFLLAASWVFFLRSRSSRWFP